MPGIAIALKLLVGFSPLAAYNDLMGTRKQLPPRASTALQGDPQAQAAAGQAVQPGSAAGAANKFITAPEQAQREDCTTYSPPGYAHTAQTAG